MAETLEDDARYLTGVEASEMLMDGYATLGLVADIAAISLVN